MEKTTSLTIISITLTIFVLFLAMLSLNSDSEIYDYVINLNCTSSGVTLPIHYNQTDFANQFLFENSTVTFNGLKSNGDIYIDKNNGELKFHGSIGYSSLYNPSNGAPQLESPYPFIAGNELYVGFEDNSTAIIYFGELADVSISREGTDLLKTDSAIHILSDVNQLLNIESSKTGNNAVVQLNLRQQTGTDSLAMIRVRNDATYWSFGIDGSNSDSFVISNSFADTFSSTKFSLSTNGVLRAYGGYQSADGSNGVTGTYSTVTVKNGLVVGGS